MSLLSGRNHALTKYLQFDLFLFSSEISKRFPCHPAPTIKYKYEPVSIMYTLIHKMKKKSDFSMFVLVHHLCLNLILNGYFNFMSQE